MDPAPPRGALSPHSPPLPLITPARTRARVEMPGVGFEPTTLELSPAAPPARQSPRRFGGRAHFDQVASMCQLVCGGPASSAAAVSLVCLLPVASAVSFFI